MRVDAVRPPELTFAGATAGSALDDWLFKLDQLFAQTHRAEADWQGRVQLAQLYWDRHMQLWWTSRQQAAAAAEVVRKVRQTAGRFASTRCSNSSRPWRRATMRATRRRPTASPRSRRARTVRLAIAAPSAARTATPLRTASPRRSCALASTARSLAISSPTVRRARRLAARSKARARGRAREREARQAERHQEASRLQKTSRPGGDRE